MSDSLSLSCRKRTPVLVPAVVLRQLAVAPASSQEATRSESPPRWWFTAGLGPSTEAFAGVAGFDADLDGPLLSLRGTVSADIMGPSFWDVGLLYGRTARRDRGALGASVGLAAIGGDRSSGLGRREPVGVHLGLPLAVRAAWYPASCFGLGTYLFANLNGERSFGGVALTFELGELR